MTTRTGRAETASGNNTGTLLNENPSGVAGETNITDEVIAAIAGHAASQVDGVVRMGSGNVARSLSDAVGSESRKKGAGVTVEAGEVEAVFDIDLTIEYPHPIPDVVSAVREAVARDVRRLAGMETREVNVEVIAIEFPEKVKRRVS